MPVHKKTLMEYYAAATLLGYLYDERDHTFFTETGRLLLFDADTLEQVHTSKERAAKYSEYSYPLR